MQEIRKSDRLAGTGAIVTGAGSGIGKGIALALARAGAVTLCADINAGAAECTAREIVAQGGLASAIHLDVTSESSAQAAVAAMLERHGVLHSLINCAGIARSGTAMDTELDVWSQVMAVNLTGTWLMCKAVLPHMVAQRSGSIINIASQAAIVAAPAHAAYTASKGGVTALTRSIAVDFAPHNVRANAICPGTVPTPLVVDHYIQRREATEDRIDEGVAATKRRYPLRRHGRPEEIGALAVHLASEEESGFMTGAIIPVDGGVSATAWQVGG